MGALGFQRAEWKIWGHFSVTSPVRGSKNPSPVPCPCSGLVLRKVVIHCPNSCTGGSPWKVREEESRGFHRLLLKLQERHSMGRGVIKGKGNHSSVPP